MADGPVNDAPYRLIDDVTFGEGVVVHSFTNLYGCTIGDETQIGTFVEIQRGAVDRRALQDPESHLHLRRGDDRGRGLRRARGAVRQRQAIRSVAGPWELQRTIVARGASLGSGAVILGGIRIGAGATVGAGAVVTQDAPDGAVVVGVPARSAQTPS